MGCLVHVGALKTNLIVWYNKLGYLLFPLNVWKGLRSSAIDTTPAAGRDRKGEGEGRLAEPKCGLI